MKKRSTFLLVVSIILIIWGAITLLSCIVGVAMKDTLEAAYATIGVEAPGIFPYIISSIGGLIMLISGIVGIAYKSRKLVLIFAVILAVFYIASIIYTTLTVGFTAFALLDLILPITYFWGWYQSN